MPDLAPHLPLTLAIHLTPGTTLLAYGMTGAVGMIRYVTSTRPELW